VFYCITGFGDAEYFGPLGIGDKRTAYERGARTVDFDVTKNVPQQTQYQDYQDQAKTTEAGNEEETVDFIFDEPTE
jgi:hypothetical protein